MKEEKHLWILESPKIITTRMGSLDASTAMFMNIWQRIARSQRQKRRLESATSATK